MSVVFSCSRTHDIPDDSCTLLFPGMYANFELEQSMRDEYDTGLCHFSSLYLAQLAELFISAGQMLSVCLSVCLCVSGCSTEVQLTCKDSAGGLLESCLLEDKCHHHST